MLLDQLHKSNGLTLNQLCETLPMTRQAVSKHLRVLENADLVAVSWRGREKLHFLNAAPIQEIYGRWLEKYEAHFSRELDHVKAKLESRSKKEK